MARAKKTRRDTLGSIERLEERRVMAGDVTARLDNGTLKIDGTAMPDEVWVSVSRLGAIVVQTRFADLGSWSPSQVRAIDARMGDGADKLWVNLSRVSSVGSIKVNTGQGTFDSIEIKNATVGSLTVDGRSGNAASVSVFDSTVSNTAEVTLGGGNDRVKFARSAFETLKVTAGAGDDNVNVENSQIRRAEIALGAGNDYFATNGSVTINGGTIDGGDGARDTLRAGKFRGVSFKNFER